ncbi:MAG TPA: LON peptidase substrate-binding domain-containing protein [Bacteroidota bacterium]|nr:LON peptidase substrate-binding domain-containing protein [Bacteroidota bacterium]
MAALWLPLFPLNVVLFPRSALPLHIFEERYKTLINECLERGTPFGISLSREDSIASIGCSARIATVTRRYDDGRMDIVVEGVRRYRLLRHEKDRGPYLVGEVEYVVEPKETIEHELASDTVNLFNTLLALVHKETGAMIGVDRFEAGLSFVIAQKAGLDLAGRQKLLEMLSENDRLRSLHDYLKDLLPRLNRLEEIERVVRNDGYI